MGASSGTTSLSYNPASQASLILVSQPTVDHAKAQGRIAFSIPGADLPGVEAKVKEAKGTILTPLISLDTPGKATVQVVILGDPDGQEICFVGSEAFRELSQVDPEAEKLLDEAIANDKSDEWFAKKGKEKRKKKEKRKRKKVDQSSVFTKDSLKIFCKNSNSY